MNKQQTFNKVVRHLRRQGKRAINPLTFSCQYRAPDGSKCAVGCLIPDELYTQDVETWPGYRVAAVLHLDEQLCTDLQGAHDDCWDTLEFALECVAQKHGLEMPEVYT